MTVFKEAAYGIIGTRLKFAPGLEHVKDLALRLAAPAALEHSLQMTSA